MLFGRCQTAIASPASSIPSVALEASAPGADSKIGAPHSPPKPCSALAWTISFPAALRPVKRTTASPPGSIATRGSPASRIGFETVCPTLQDAAPATCVAATTMVVSRVCCQTAIASPWASIATVGSAAFKPGEDSLTGVVHAPPAGRVAA
jgi:hypothetical protein